MGVDWGRGSVGSEPLGACVRPWLPFPALGRWKLEGQELKAMLSIQ